MVNGDILDFSTENNKAIVIRIDLKPVLVIDLGGIANLDKDIIINRCIEIGHAIGNQHWPAVVKGTKVYVPLTVDRKVMLSVMDTHSIEGITYSFQEGQEIIPYLLPQEIRRLFGATGTDSNTHTHAHHVHDHDHDHDHSHDGNHSHTH